LPANWKGICVLALLIPQINIVPNNQNLSIPTKRDIQLIPLLIGLEIMSGIGTGIGGIASSVFYYNQLTINLTKDRRSG
jgi:hypothetical protein